MIESEGEHCLLLTLNNVDDMQKYRVDIALKDVHDLYRITVMRHLKVVSIACTRFSMRSSKIKCRGFPNIYWH